MGRSRIGSSATRLGNAVAAVALVVLAASATGADPVRVQRGDGTTVEGELRGVTAGELEIALGPDALRIPLSEVRTLERVPAPQPAAPGGVRVILVDGGWIEGQDLSWDGGAIRLERPEGPVTIPAERVRTAAWRRAGDAVDAVPGAAWSATLPEAAGSDLLVVAAGEGQEVVECAITGVSAEAVTIVLDEETIPVKRAKVVGIHWLRPADAGSPPGVAVAVVGGNLHARRLEWSGEEVVLDGDLRLPAIAVARLDWSAGRTVPLATTAPERVDVEPWFGGLAGAPGLAAALGPRVLGAEEGIPGGGLLVRPRTTAVWRVPAEAKRFRATASPADGARHGAAAVLVVAVDGREVERRTLEATAAGAATTIPLDVDLAGARRLSVTVDFGVATDPGCAVRLAGPVIER